MIDACPNCGSRDVRVTSQMTLGEKLRSIFGRFPVRCKRCSARFESGIWKLSMARYAKCPRCYRTELSHWKVQSYAVPAAMSIKLSLGATPFRCEHCRCNFASFKPCHERFSWRKLRERAVKTLPPGSSEGAEDEPDSVSVQ